MTIGPDLWDRYVITEKRKVPGRQRPFIKGYSQWRVGDSVSLHLAIEEPWTLVEARICVVISSEIYRVVITKFDDQLQSLGGFAIGDEFPISHEYFYAIWAPGYTREDGEGTQKVHQEGSLRRDLKFLKSEPADDVLYQRVRTLIASVDSDTLPDDDSGDVDKLFAIQKLGLVTSDEVNAVLRRLYDE